MNYRWTADYHFSDFNIIRQYPKISLSEERKLISKAKKGSKKSRDELIFRHIGFLKFRIHKKAFPALVRRFGEDLLSESILIVYKKIKNYNLNYRNKRGELHPVRFISCIWKRIDGFIIDYLRKDNHYHSSNHIATLD
ncbi:MAG: hypothetical protein DRP74_06055 [Candidatus Omnitrophota bacterium]|nr:MAG: hypothetical protein DRP74_06055 [Candidatus Omnitrophota bacterium]